MEAEVEMEVAETESGGGSAVPECLSSFVDLGSVESHRYFLARRTLLEMLRDRGFPVPDDELALTLPAFRAKLGDKPKLDDLRISLSVPSKGSPPKKLLVIFFGTEPFKLSTLREMYNAVKQENLTNLILVLQSKMSSKARDGVKEISRIKVETFQITELLVNITKHVLMPKHEFLTTDEKQDLLKKYNVGESQFPRMLETDPVSRYYGLKKGQIVKVTYEGELTGSHVTYRCVM
ncbi:DNA-directed RNA polymerase V subunit 5A [Curcuma longa]|uniref:DNA-directed RNA polymerase V subunit 5A n=1 Tax=Curcuma longa TaxID=136217 RepID=UPI003D9FA14C